MRLLREVIDPDGMCKREAGRDAADGDSSSGRPGTIMPPADKAVEIAKRAEADGYDSIWWPSHLMGWHPESVWTEDITPLAKFQANPHTYFDPLVMMPVSSARRRSGSGSASSSPTSSPTIPRCSRRRRSRSTT